VQFNSQVTQVVGSTTIPPSIISTTTDSSGNMAPMSVAQGLFGTFQFCQGHSSTNVGGAGGGCAAAINGLIPINTTGNIQAVIAGTLLPSVGNATVNNLTVTNNTMVGGTLQVTGNTTLTTLNTTGPITTNSLMTAPSLSLTNNNCSALTFAKATMLSIPSGQDWLVAAGAHCTGTGGTWTADDDSAVLFGNYTVTGWANNAGWQWIGNTGLTVGSSFTPALLMTLADQPATVTGVTHVGILTTNSLRLQNGISTALQFAGGSIVTAGNPNLNIEMGAHYNGSNWIGDATQVSGMSLFTTGTPLVEFTAATGVTIGSTYTSSVLAQGWLNGWTFNGTNPVLIANSLTNANSDIIEVFPQNQTQGVGILWSGLHSIGSAAAVAMNIDAKGGASINLNTVNVGGPVITSGTVFIQDNYHLTVQNNGILPTFATCSGGSFYGTSTDVQGQVNFTGAGAQSCTILFARTWANTPICVCSVALSTSPMVTGQCVVTVGPTQATFNFSGAIQNGTAIADYHCIGG
jgi:hypothetical protein